jgi:hypothetical protein
VSVVNYLPECEEYYGFYAKELGQRIERQQLRLERVVEHHQGDEGVRYRQVKDECDPEISVVQAEVLLPKLPAEVCRQKQGKSKHGNMIYVQVVHLE